MFLETAASSAVTGEITPDVKNAERRRHQGSLVCSSDRVNYFQWQMPQWKVVVMTVWWLYTTKEWIVIVLTVSPIPLLGYRWASQSEGKLWLVPWVCFRIVFSKFTHKWGSALQPPTTRDQLWMSQNSILTANGVEELFLGNCIPLWILRWETIRGECSTINITRMSRLWKVQREP